MLDAALWQTQWTCGRSGCGGHGGVAEAVDVVDAVDAVGHGCDEGPGDMERKERVFCSHIGSKNISIF